MADVPINADDPDWLGWWEIVKQHFPSLFDGTGPRIGQAMAEAGEELVRTAQRLEGLNQQLRANPPSRSTLRLLRQYAPGFVQPTPTAEHDIANRRQARENIVGRLRRHA